MVAVTRVGKPYTSGPAWSTARPLICPTTDPVVSTRIVPSATSSRDHGGSFLRSAAALLAQNKGGFPGDVREPAEPGSELAVLGSDAGPVLSQGGNCRSVEVG